MHSDSTRNTLAKTEPPLGFGLPRSARLIKAYEFRRVYGRGVRVHGQSMTLVAFRRRSPGLRLGLSVSKEHGCAVRRNKIKRLLREAFRLERPQLPGRYDLITIPRKRSSKYHLEQLRRELRELVHRVEAGIGKAATKKRRKRQ